MWAKVVCKPAYCHSTCGAKFSHLWLKEWVHFSVQFSDPENLHFKRAQPLFVHFLQILRKLVIAKMHHRPIYRNMFTFVHTSHAKNDALDGLNWQARPWGATPWHLSLLTSTHTHTHTHWRSPCCVSKPMCPGVLQGAAEQEASIRSVTLSVKVEKDLGKRFHVIPSCRMIFIRLETEIKCKMIREIIVFR